MKVQLLRGRTRQLHLQTADEKGIVSYMCKMRAVKEVATASFAQTKDSKVEAEGSGAYWPTYYKRSKPRVALKETNLSDKTD